MSKTAHTPGLRSNRVEVRNPVLALPAMQALLALPADQRHVIEALMRDLSRDAQERADKCWRKHKGPMAAYWKATGVYAKHIARALAGCTCVKAEGRS